MQRLTKQQVGRIYKTYLTADFPADERKPLAIIYRAMDAGQYECFGLLEDGALMGYAFFKKTGQHYMLDYFATVPEHRNQGVGTRMLRELAAAFYQADSVIAEVDAPEAAQSSEERSFGHGG